jgi:hypothetical protein
MNKNYLQLQAPPLAQVITAVMMMFTASSLGQIGILTGLLGMFLLFYALVFETILLANLIANLWVEYKRVHDEKN